MPTLPPIQFAAESWQDLKRVLEQYHRDVESALYEEDWIEVSAGDFQNSWANYGSNFSPLMYRLTIGVVEVVGMISGGATGTEVTQLPSSHCPKYHQMFPAAVQNTVAGRVQISKTGSVTAWYASGTTPWLSFFARYRIV